MKKCIITVIFIWAILKLSNCISEQNPKYRKLDLSGLTDEEINALVNLIKVMKNNR